jgi:hypothetical protein
MPHQSGPILVRIEFQGDEEMNTRQYANENRISGMISFNGLLILAMMAIGAIAAGGTVAQAAINQFGKVSLALN